EEVADRVRAVVLEALGAVAALQQESLAGRDARERALQVARLAGKDERRKRRKLRLDGGKLCGIRVLRHLDNRFPTPAIPRPTLGHDANSSCFALSYCGRLPGRARGGLYTRLRAARTA